MELDCIIEIWKDVEEPAAPVDCTAHRSAVKKSINTSDKSKHDNQGQKQN